MLRKYFIIFAFILSACSAVQDGGRDQKDKNEDKEAGLTGPISEIAYAYHGLLVNENYKEIKLTKEKMAVLQQSLLTNLLQDLAKQESESYRLAVAESTSEVEWQGVTDLIIIRNAWVAKIIAESSKDITLKYLWIHRLLNERVYEIIDYTPELWVVNPKLLELLNRYRIWDFVGLPNGNNNNYISDCSAHQVPTPPDWGFPGSAWQRQGIQNSQFTFVSSNRTTEVWAYNEPTGKGICIALPRINQATGSIELLGIICQSERTGKACFWDNINAATGARIRGQNIQMRIADIKNGSNLAENCTDCHRGDNAYMIHPGTTLDLGAPYDTDPAVRYSPIGQANWGNPGPRHNQGVGGCATCHEIPELMNDNNTAVNQSFYCGILRQAVTKTMPSQAQANNTRWNTPLPAYAAHVNGFRNDCP